MEFLLDSINNDTIYGFALQEACWDTNIGELNKIQYKNFENALQVIYGWNKEEIIQHAYSSGMLGRKNTGRTKPQILKSYSNNMHANPLIGISYVSLLKLAELARKKKKGNEINLWEGEEYMNEATLEARLNTELDRLFPSLERLDITHQKSFSLRLGHNHITVNGFEKVIAGGRLDVLISYKDKPLAIVELKRPNIDLNSEDVEQGISYARLLNPMPPLVIISNGSDTQYYHSFDMKPWDPKEINEEIIQRLISYGISNAGIEHDEAIKILIGQQPDLWKNILINYTKGELKELEGRIDDFSLPIAADFQIERSIVGNVLDSCLKYPLVNLIGDPLSGKTSIAYQLCHSCPNSVVPLYIDSNSNYGILQKISNRFTSGLFKNMTPSDVRNWLINSFRAQTSDRIMIIIDNLCSVNDSEIWKEIFELIDINENNTFSILLIMNEFVFNSVGTVVGKSMKNKIGKAPVVKTLHLSDDEFYKTHQQLIEDFGVSFHNGAQYNVEYRNPRLLRLLISRFSKERLSITQEDNSTILLPSITTFDILDSAWNNIVTDIDIQTDLRYLVEAVLEEESIRDIDPILSIMSFNRGTITNKTAERLLGNSRMERLKSNGLIQRFNLFGGKAYISPKFPEAFSAAAAYYLAEKLADMYLQDKQVELYDYLKKTAPLFPYGDLVATMAIIEACKKNPNILSNIVSMLLEDEPKIEKPGGKGKYLAFFEDIGEINFEGEMDGILISNWYPWLILSHLASLPIGDERENRDIQLYIFSKVGSFENVLLRIDNIPFKEMKGYHVHDTSEGFSFLCGNVGIVEPITFAMQSGLYSIPDKMIELCNYAVEQENKCLLMRLNTASRSTVNCSDKIVHECSQIVQEATANIIKNI